MCQWHTAKPTMLTVKALPCATHSKLQPAKLSLPWVFFGTRQRFLPCASLAQDKKENSPNGHLTVTAVLPCALMARHTAKPGTFAVCHGKHTTKPGIFVICHDQGTRPSRFPVVVFQRSEMATLPSARVIAHSKVTILSVFFTYLVPN